MASTTDQASATLTE
jgi:hypothetical protein